MATAKHEAESSHRRRTAEETWAILEPLLPRFGITRVADITRLDEIDLPTWSAIRPRGQMLQVSNGKGATPLIAKLSAVMEAIDLHMAENPSPDRLRRASFQELVAEGSGRVIAPEGLDGFTGGYHAKSYRVDWTQGESLADGAPVWVPASEIYFGVSPYLHFTSTHGLAGGNDRDEATLHALYELVERDAVSRLSSGGKVRVREQCGVVNLARELPPEVERVITAIQGSRTKCVLLQVPSVLGVPVFWAVLLNNEPFASGSTLNVGWGAHFDPATAACRALREAAQSRVIFISGSREDLISKPAFQSAAPADSPAFRYFEKLTPTLGWDEVAAQYPGSPGSIAEALIRLREILASHGHGDIWRFDLTRDTPQISVVKILVPSLTFRRRLF